MDEAIHAPARRALPERVLIRGTTMDQVVILSLVTASVAFMLCETTLFAGLREWVKARSVWVGKLACCGYCLGHWVAFGLVAIYRPKFFEA